MSKWITVECLCGEGWVVERYRSHSVNCWKCKRLYSMTLLRRLEKDNIVRLEQLTEALGHKQEDISF